MNSQMLRALAVACEMTGTTLSKEAMLGFIAELEAYPEAQVLRAIERCRREVKHRLTLAEIIQRIEEDDGRPGAEEAWARCLPAFDEAETAVLSQEMMEAMRSARPLLAEKDKIGARMTFKEVYEKAVRQARAEKHPLRWEISLGFSPEGRRIPLERAVKAQELTLEQVRAYLPGRDESPLSGLLEHDSSTGPEDEDKRRTREQLRNLIASLKGARA
jgi:DNA-binding transcriptional MerR regulator